MTSGASGRLQVNVTIAGFGHFAPERRVTNAEIEDRLNVGAGWIERRTGVRERRYALDDEALSDLAVKAGELALDDAGIDRSTIALTLLATSTPDHLLPPTAPFVANRLDLDQAGGIDLAGACGGFLYALTLADGYVRTRNAPVLVIGANVLSRRINPADRGTSALFSDAAGAVVLVPTDRKGAGILGSKLLADGSGYDLIKIPAGGSRKPFAPDLASDETKMIISDGRAVFLKAVHMMADCSKAALEEAGLQAMDVDLFVPHQANARMMEAVRHQLGIPPEKMVSTVAMFANSSAATIPFSLSHAAKERQLQPGTRILMCAAGAGLTAGGVVLCL